MDDLTHDVCVSHIWMTWHTTCVCHTYGCPDTRRVCVTHMDDLTHDVCVSSQVIHLRNKITGLFRKRALWKRRYSAQEIYNFKEPTNRSQPIVYYTEVITCSVLHDTHTHTHTQHDLCVSSQIIHMCDKTHPFVYQSLKMIGTRVPQGNEYRLFHRALLQKRPIISVSNENKSYSRFLVTRVPQGNEYMTRFHVTQKMKAHIWMSNVTCTTESCYTCENESCHTDEWVMLHIWMSHVTKMNESCHTQNWVMAHQWEWVM